MYKKSLTHRVCVCGIARFVFWFSLEFYSFLFRTFALSRRIGKIYTLPRLPTKVSDFLVLKNYNNDNSKRSYGIFVSSWKIVWLFGFRYTQREVEFRFLKNLNFGFALHWFCCLFRVIRVCMCVVTSVRGCVQKIRTKVILLAATWLIRVREILDPPRGLGF